MPRQKKETFEDFLAETITTYQPILGLSDYKIYHKETTEHEYIALNYTYPYATTTVLFNKKAKEDFEEKKESRLEMRRVIIHELRHILTDPLYSKATYRFVGKNEIEDERERLTDRIANIVHQNIIINTKK